MHVLVHRVIRRSAVTYVGVRHETHGFEDFQRSVDRREVHAGRGVLDLRENLLRGSMSQILDRLENQLALRCDATVSRSRCSQLSVVLSAIVSAYSPACPDVATDRRYRPSAETSGVSDAAR